MVPADGGAMVAAAPAQPPPQDRGDMSFELRAEISAGIAKLTANNIQKVVDIIRQTMPGLGHDDREIELDVNALDNVTLWRLYDFIKQCQATRKPGRPKKGGNSAANQAALMQDATRQTEQNLQSVRAKRNALGGDGGGSSGFGGADDDWIDEGDSDDGFGGGGGGGSTGMWDNFQSARQQQERDAQARLQRERVQQDAMRQEQVNAKRSAADRAAAAQRERESQRAAERCEQMPASHPPSPVPATLH